MGKVVRSALGLADDETMEKAVDRYVETALGTRDEQLAKAVGLIEAQGKEIGALTEGLAKAEAQLAKVAATPAAPDGSHHRRKGSPGFELHSDPESRACQLHTKPPAKPSASLYQSAASRR
jgi:hypothetical protein